MAEQEKPSSVAVTATATVTPGSSSQGLVETIRAGHFTNALIVLLVGVIAGILLLCFLRKPLWEVGATTCLLALTHGLAIAIGAKYGSMNPGSGDGMMGKIKRLFACPRCGYKYDPKEGSSAKPDDPDG